MNNIEKVLIKELESAIRFAHYSRDSTVSIKIEQAIALVTILKLSIK